MWHRMSRKIHLKLTLTINLDHTSSGLLVPLSSSLIIAGSYLDARMAQLHSARPSLREVPV